jgi:hypothetical protein
MKEPHPDPTEQREALVFAIAKIFGCPAQKRSW